MRLLDPAVLEPRGEQPYRAAAWRRMAAICDRLRQCGVGDVDVGNGDVPLDWRVDPAIAASWPNLSLPWRAYPNGGQMVTLACHNGRALRSSLPIAAISLNYCGVEVDDNLARYAFSGALFGCHAEVVGLPPGMLDARGHVWIHHALWTRQDHRGRGIGRLLSHLALAAQYTIDPHVDVVTGLLAPVKGRVDLWPVGSTVGRGYASLHHGLELVADDPDYMAATAMVRMDGVDLRAWLLGDYDPGTARVDARGGGR
jgi:GNAT superfamily N-acetyltransferase